ncbi:hypothetical protein [Asticcacaulis sp.]|uniref:hypothetical protein n=1 Tax=Asticcacaulis sp. TaxID=1872648 RepID=UPI0026132250|nr:hypothetical protein [Asticcacaulis sp.]
MWAFLTILAGLFVLVGLGGMIWGATERTQARRKQGLWVLRTGMVLGGICLSLKAFSGDTSNIIYGMMLLVFGTAVTDLGPKADKSGKPEA